MKCYDKARVAIDFSSHRTDTEGMHLFAQLLDRELAPRIEPSGPTGLDLFAGAGGLTIGLKAAGVRTVAAVEVDPYRVATLAKHTSGAELLLTDVRQMDFTRFRGVVQLVYGGPPCQPFSSGGLRKAAADGRDMIPEFLRAVEEIQPTAVLLENVPGLVSGDRLKYLTGVIERLEAAGFCAAWRVLNAADYGIPQKRRRLFVVGLRDRTFHFPRATHGVDGSQPDVAVRDALPGKPLGEPNPSKVFYARTPDLRPSPYDGHLFNGGGRPIDLSQPCHTILASAGGNKTHFFDTLSLVPAYHRYLMAGGHPKTGVLEGTRRLTVAESAVLQTFPPGMSFCGPRSAQYHQIGDAVPPLLAKALGRALIEQMNEPTTDRRTSRRPRARTLFE